MLTIDRVLFGIGALELVGRYAFAFSLIVFGAQHFEYASFIASLIGLMFFLWVLVLHGPRVLHALHNGDGWSSLFVTLGMAGASWIVASTFARGKMDIV